MISQDQDIAGTQMKLSDAIAHMADAEILVTDTHRVPSEPVLRLAAETRHSPYDCEYVHLVKSLSCQVVTFDQRLTEVFPETAVTPVDFATSQE